MPGCCSGSFTGCRAQAGEAGSAALQRLPKAQILPPSCKDIQCAFLWDVLPAFTHLFRQFGLSNRWQLSKEVTNTLARTRFLSGPNPLSRAAHCSWPLEAIYHIHCCVWLCEIAEVLENISALLINCFASFLCSSVARNDPVCVWLPSTKSLMAPASSRKYPTIFNLNLPVCSSKL